MHSHQRQIGIFHIAVLVCLFVFAFSVCRAGRAADGFLRIYFLDVGQGDAIFIETPNGNQVLIDGGPDQTVLQRLGQVMPFFDRSIDVVLLTHPDADHVSGLIPALERYEVGHIIDTKADYGGALQSAWLEAAAQEEAEFKEARSGLVFDLGAGVIMKIIYPFDSLIDKSGNEPNNNSIVAMLEYGELEVLLTGDIETETERRLILNGADLDADILKAGHHGSKTSTTEEFLGAVTPQTAIISAGRDNRYGHPHQEVLNRLEKFAVPYYRTDTQGTIVVTSDGENYFITHD